tara:strand:+ start:2166 stop:2345 length:180 start_codon:yes stop_codon:yes gene_type:complete
LIQNIKLGLRQVNSKIDSEKKNKQIVIEQEVVEQDQSNLLKPEYSAINKLTIRINDLMK